MNDDIQQLRNLIDTYKLSRPLSQELQQLAIESRTPDLRHILMKSGKYSLISWIGIMTFLLLRKFGIHITLIQSKIVATITAAAVVSGSATIVYRGAKYVIDATSRPASKIEETIDRSETDTVKKIENSSPDALTEQNRILKKQSFHINNNMIAPAEKKLPDNGKPEKVKKQKGSKHNTINDIPNL